MKSETYNDALLTRYVKHYLFIIKTENRQQKMGAKKEIRGNLCK